MNLYTVQTAMQKQAVGSLLPFSLTKAFGSLFATGAEGAHNLGLYLLGAAAAGGIGIGAFSAYITAHGKRDEDTVKKEYENERLKADIGYVSSRLEDEYNRAKTATKPKAARVLNV